MNRRMRRWILLLATLAASCAYPAKKKDADFDAFLRVYAKTWNEHDGVALSTQFTADADLIVGNLPQIDGREAIGEWWDTYFSRLDEGRRGEFEILSLRDIAPGVRLVNIGSKTSGTSERGEELETRLARGTWVVVERNNTWLITAMRAFPALGEDRFAPGEDR